MARKMTPKLASVYNSVLAVMRKTVLGKESVSWEDFVAAVKEAKLDVKEVGGWKDWNDARNVLQFMINKKELVRTTDYHVEVYKNLQFK